MITDTFDQDSRGLISPEEALPAKVMAAAKKYEIETFIMTFSSKLVSYLQEIGEIEILDEDLYFGSAADKHPVYRIKGSDVCVFLTGIGGMMTAAMLEELDTAFKAKNYIVFGSCGVLKPIEEGKLIVPDEAYRDEGVSYHYAKAADHIRMKNAEKLGKMLDEMGVSYVTGKTWTTDGFYRETEHNRDKRMKDGCICVEMECSAMQAVCDFKGLELYHFLYGADSLNGAWQRRILGNLEMDSRVTYYDLAKKIAEALKK